MEKERTSILLNREDMLKLKAISKNIGKSTTFLIQEAVSEFISKTLPKRKIEIIGMVESGEPFFADNDEKILEEINSREE
jgi:hypothetical protein